MLFEDIKDYVVYAGKGVGNDLSLAPKHTFLIPVITPAHVLHLSKKYQQHAFVFAKVSRPAALVSSQYSR